MTGKELVTNLQTAIINELNKTGVTNADGTYIENCLTCAIGAVLLKAQYSPKQIERYFMRAIILLNRDTEVDFTKEITNKED